MSQSTSQPSPPSHEVKTHHHQFDPSRNVNQSRPVGTIDMSTFGPTAPAPSTGNAHLFFHLGHTGHEVAPKGFPACVSAGKGVIVREGHLHGAWTCVRPFQKVDVDVDVDVDEDHYSCLWDDRVPRTVTFPADTSANTPAHTIRIVGCRVIEFSVLEADAKAESARFVRLKVKALVAAANEQFSPQGSTEGVPIWIGVDESLDNIFRAVDGHHGSWEVRCDGGAVVRF